MENGDAKIKDNEQTRERLDSEMGELQSGMVGETGGDRSHGRVQTCYT